MSNTSAVTTLDLGRLLRMVGSVTEAAQMKVTHEAAGALARAYLRLRTEMLVFLEGEPLSELRKEFERLFPAVPEPPASIPNPLTPMGAKWAESASEAQLHLSILQGWIQGLIDEQTLERRIVAEAEAKARAAMKPGTGFGA